MIIDGRQVSPAGFDEYGDHYTDCFFEIKDDSVRDNYFELFFVGRAFDEVWFTTNDGIVTNDPSVINTGLEDFGNHTLLFSDQLFSGEQKTLFFKYGSGRTGVLDTEIELPSGRTRPFAILRDVSEEYFLFRTSWVKHRYSQLGKPAILSDPIIDDLIDVFYKPDLQPLYSNMENAFGYFGGYSEQLYEMKEE